MAAGWDRISRLFHEALAGNLCDRQAFLDEACAGNSGLRAELESLLAQTPTVDRSTIDGSLPLFGLAAAPLSFASLGPETFKNLLAAMSFREFKAGELLIRQGDAAEYLLLILNGRAVARLRDAPADRPPIGEFGPGDVVGEMSLVTNELRTADVVSQTQVRALELSSEAFHALALRYPLLSVVLTDVVADRLGHAAHDGLGGKEIHGYRIVQCVGRGGMGVVYEAERSANGERVALKMMNHRLVYRPDALRRFRREAEVLKSLRHPCIARLYDSFPAYQTEFLVMEFCAGSTLGHLISSRGALDEEVVRKLLGQLAPALKHIHERGLIHRDLKPSNIMVTESCGIKLLDFGLAKSDDSRAADAGTQSAMIGTLRYMAPELFAGQRADPRADVYALACVAYEALSGRPVLDASDVFGIVREHMRFTLPPRDQIGRGISSEMYEVLASGLNRSPEERVCLDRFAALADTIQRGSI